MRLLSLITLRGLGTRRLRSILTLFGIVLGVAAMFAINFVNRNAYDAVTRLFEETSGKVSLEVGSSSGDSGISLAILDLVEEIDGIKGVYPVLEVMAALPESGNEELNLGILGLGAEGLLLYGVDLSKDSDVRDYVMYEGRLPEEGESLPQLALTREYAEEKELKLGDKVRVLTTVGPADLLLVGLLDSEGMGLTNSGRFGVLSLGAAQSTFRRGGDVNRLDILAEESPNPEFLDTLRERMELRLGSAYSVEYPGGQGEQMNQMLSGYQISLNFMAGIALFVGAFLIYNSLSMTVAERGKELGLLRCVGMTARQVMTQVWLEGLILGVLGGLLGAGLGIFLSQSLTRIMGEVLGQPLVLGSIPLDLLVISVVLGVAVTLISALVPAISAGRTRPLSALHMRKTTKSEFLERFGWIAGVLLLLASVAILLWNPFPYDVQFRLGSITVFSLFLGATLTIPATLGVWQALGRWPLRLLFGTIGEIGSRNLKRSKRRTMLTAAALMVGVSMIVSTQGITGSFTQDLDVWMDAFMGGDLYLSSAVMLPASLKSELEELPGVDTVAPVRMMEAVWLRGEEEESLTFMGVDPKSYTSVTRFIFSGDTVEDDAIEALTEGGSIFISEVLSKKFGLVAGNSLRLRTNTGERSYEIAAVILDFSNQGLVVTGNLKDLEADFGVTEVTSFSLTLSQGANIDEVTEQIKREYSDTYPIIVESNARIKNRAQDLMDQAFSMFDVLGVLAVLVAALGVLNTLTMSVVERTREIGMLRSMGMTRSQVVRMILAEAGLMGLIGGVLGLAFGLLLTWILLATMGAMSGYSLDFVLPIRALWMSILVAVVTSLIAALLPAMRAAKTPMLSAIHYE